MERPAEGFEGSEGGQRAVLNALKKRWLGPVAARVALERPAEGFEGFEGGQTAVLNALKNRWLKLVAARVALETLAEGFEALSRVAARVPWKGMREAARVALERPVEGFEGFEGGQTAVLNALKNRCAGACCSCESCCGKAFGRV